MNLAEKFRHLAHALQPLGIEIGSDVLDLWRDRDTHGRDPLPASALEELADAINVLRWSEPHDPRMGGVIRARCSAARGRLDTTAAEPGD
jgi:hypothetical protein